jgi:hypothetical protein
VDAKCEEMLSEKMSEASVTEGKALGEQLQVLLS